MNTPITAFSRKASLRLGRASGFTLIEMMISITIGLGILAGLVGVLASTSGNSKSNDRTSELMTNGRYALNSIKQELRQGGFRGYTWAEPGTPGPWVAPNVGCAEAGDTVDAFVSNIRQGIWGADNRNPFAGVGNCIPDANYAAGTDVVVIRRLAGSPISGAAIADTVYFQSSYNQGRVFRGAVAPVFTGTATPLATFAIQEYVYFIRPWTVSAAENPQIPALCRVALLANGTMATELVASGIERMKVQYGRLTTIPDMQYFNTLSGTSSDSPVTNPLYQWDEVDSVRIWLLARNTTAEPGYVNSTPYSMGNAPDYVPNDGFRRQMFTTVVQVRNGKV